MRWGGMAETWLVKRVAQTRLAKERVVNLLADHFTFYLSFSYPL